MRAFSLLLIGGFFAQPFEARAAELPPPDRPIEAIIDQLVDVRLKQENLTPAPQADDANLIRRLSLDLIGRIPTAAEVKAYVESKGTDKRAKLVDRLMASPAFVRHQAEQFTTMMSFQTRRGGDGGALRDYLNKALVEDRSWDRIFRELVTPDEKDASQKGASEFLRTRINDLDRATIDVSVLFFGVNVSCAQCHDHPHVKDWKQDNFYGMKAFFNRTFESGGSLAEREFGLVKFKANKGPEKAAKMMFLTGAVIDDPGSREPTKEEAAKEKTLVEQAKKNKGPIPAPRWSARAKLVEVALKPGGSDFFARAITNRLWHRFMGCGLVTPLDQMHSENPPSHPELLAWLARDMAAHGYELRRMMRGIVMSQAYSRSSVWPEGRGSAPSARLFAVAQLKPLTPMQLATSLRVATADPQQFENGKPEEIEKRLESLEQSARGFASQIAQPTNDDFQIGVNEALLFSNNDRIDKELLVDGSDRLLGRLKQVNDPNAAVKLIFAAVLSRQPKVDESKAISEYLQKRSDRPGEAYRQVLWALLTGAEFRFNY